MHEMRIKAASDPSVPVTSGEGELKDRAGGELRRRDRGSIPQYP